MSRLWLYSLVPMIVLITLRIIFDNKRVVINPIVMKADQSVFQLNEINNQLADIVSAKQIQLSALTSELASLTTMRDNLSHTLDLAIAAASTQVVVVPPVVQDPEIVLLVNLRSDLLTFMNANFVPTTVYIKSSPFYTSIDNIISGYLNTTTLTLSAFLLKFDDPKTVAFRQAVQQIYDTTTFYIFDDFYNQLLAA